MLYTIQTDSLFTRSTVPALRENDPITQTEWEQLVQIHTQIRTLGLPAQPAARSVLFVREPNRGELVFNREVNCFLLKMGQ